jgi:hypothetical protein
VVWLSSSVGSIDDIRDSKTNRYLTDIVKHFKHQASPSTCYTVSIHNILTELSERQGDKRIKLSEKRINQLTKFREFIGPKLEIVVRNINKEIMKYGYKAYEDFNGTYQQLLDILKDTQCSYPLVGLAHSYLVNERGLFRGEENIELPPDHVVTVIDINEENTFFFDPYGRYSRFQSDFPEGIFTLSTSRFLDEYWTKALFCNWLFWIGRSDAGTQKLDSYL